MDKTRTTTLNDHDMIRNIWPVILLLLLSPALEAQDKPLPRASQLVDLSGTIGNSQGTVAASYIHNWRLGKRRKWEIGGGVRWTVYTATKSDFTTAPARLARGTTIPFVIVFAPQKTDNWDTLPVQRPLVHSVNLSVNFGYHFSGKWMAGFNIDLAGFSIGPRRNSILTSNGRESSEPNAKPASFNVLLTGDNDYGSLNSEFFLRYKWAERWSLRAIYGFYFAEYKTVAVRQTAPDGTLVDRFRNKVNTGGLGVSYFF